MAKYGLIHREMTNRLKSLNEQIKCDQIELGHRQASFDRLASSIDFTTRVRDELINALDLMAHADADVLGDD